MVVNWNGFIDLRNLNILNLIFVLEQLGDLRILFGHFFEFLLSDRSSLLSIIDLKNILFRNHLLIYSRPWWLNDIFRSRHFQDFCLLLWIDSSLTHQSLLHLYAVMSDSELNKAHTPFINDFKITSLL